MIKTDNDNNQSDKINKKKNTFIKQQESTKITKSGQRMKCSACQLIAHQNCIPIVNEKTQLACKPTYRDVGVRQYREQAVTHHHWVHRKMEKGKCKQCGKVRKLPH
uniref:Phorbol-ester/DAG-type domain-containing protein n=1 Tax=Glossina pallidipes TaxID=7398 RepID=A0A1A9Z9Q1_GLOPL